MGTGHACKNVIFNMIRENLNGFGLGKAVCVTSFRHTLTHTPRHTLKHTHTHEYTHTYTHTTTSNIRNQFYLLLIF